MTGFNVTTISRALNNAPELSQETRERVQRIAAEIGYVPDRTALRLRTGRTHVISLILDPHDEILGFGRSMVSGLTAALRDTPYHLVITPNFRNVAPIEPINYILRHRAADGVIFSRTEPDDERVRVLLENDFPFVSHGRTELPVPHPYVDYDNFAFAYHAVKRLHAKGRRRIATILPDSRFTFGKHLREGFMSAIAETGQAHEIASGLTLDTDPKDICAATTRRFHEPDPPDGYVCSGDAAAMGVMAGIVDAGREIGRDVDIVAKQTSSIFGLVRPRVDAIYEDTALAGLQMGELLLRRIRGERPETLQILHRPAIWF
ncbi:MAG TPA: LacI family DNA-binding transcriptional regulator [Alphaproteobacteria bacterium]|nr:LacI family DNA-binding transcriptional regulator [Alphaproteobacteria bacterium]